MFLCRIVYNRYSGCRWRVVDISGCSPGLSVLCVGTDFVTAFICVVSVLTGLVRGEYIDTRGHDF